MFGSPAVQPSRRWKDTTEEKFSKGEELFGLLVKVGHWSLWWEALFWGRHSDDALPAQIGNRHPRPSLSERGVETVQPGTDTYRKVQA